jgi:hypothetical protein
MRQLNKGILACDSWASLPCETGKSAMPNAAMSVPCCVCGDIVRVKRGQQDQNLHIQGLAKNQDGELFLVVGFTLRGAIVHPIVFIVRDGKKKLADPHAHLNLRALLPVLQEEGEATALAVAHLTATHDVGVIALRGSAPVQRSVDPAPLVNSEINSGVDDAVFKSTAPVTFAKRKALLDVVKSEHIAKKANAQQTLKSFFTATPK